VRASGQHCGGLSVERRGLGGGGCEVVVRDLRRREGGCERAVALLLPKKQGHFLAFATQPYQDNNQVRVSEFSLLPLKIPHLLILFKKNLYQLPLPPLANYTEYPHRLMLCCSQSSVLLQTNDGGSHGPMIS